MVFALIPPVNSISYYIKGRKKKTEKQKRNPLPKTSIPLQKQQPCIQAQNPQNLMFGPPTGWSIKWKEIFTTIG